VNTLHETVFRAMFIVRNQNLYQISAHWLKIKSQKNFPDYQLNINRINNSSLPSSQHPNSVSP